MAAPAEAAGFFMEVSEANRYTIQEVIGKGSYGVVCSAIDNTNGAWLRRAHALKGRRG